MAGGAGQASAAATASTPSTPIAARSRSLPRPAAGSDAAARLRPRITTVRATKPQARPSDWTPRSASVAPGAPKAFDGAEGPAAFRLGSAAL